MLLAEARQQLPSFVDEFAGEGGGFSAQRYVDGTRKRVEDIGRICLDRGRIRGPEEDRQCGIEISGVIKACGQPEHGADRTSHIGDTLRDGDRLSIKIGPLPVETRSISMPPGVRELLMQLLTHTPSTRHTDSRSYGI